LSFIFKRVTMVHIILEIELIFIFDGKILAVSLFDGTLLFKTKDLEQ